VLEPCDGRLARRLTNERRFADARLDDASDDTRGRARRVNAQSEEGQTADRRHHLLLVLDKLVHAVADELAGRLDRLQRRLAGLAGFLSQLLQVKLAVLALVVDLALVVGLDLVLRRELKQEQQPAGQPAYHLELSFKAHFVLDRGTAHRLLLLQ